MKRLVIVLVLSSLPFGTSYMAQRRRAVAPPAPKPPAPVEINFGDPMPNLSDADRALFEKGRADFEHLHSWEEGLGPVFNSTACAGCHNIPTAGGGSLSTTTRIGSIVNGVFNPLLEAGGPLMQIRAITGQLHGFSAERIPAGTQLFSRRRAPVLFGLGLVDDTPDITFINLAAAQAARNDGTAGRVSFVDNIAAGMRTVGKFGWKAQVPTLHQFAGDAYLNELGITNPQFPNENCPAGRCAELEFNPRPGLNDDGRDVALLTAYMRFLAPPPRGPITPQVTAGEAVFQRIGCESCHVSTLQTASGVTYHPYSDFLLHDMGPTETEVPQGDATAREFRTPPLWGMRTQNPWLMHTAGSGSAVTAIMTHRGQALPAKQRFQALNPTDRENLLAFLMSL